MSLYRTPEYYCTSILLQLKKKKKPRRQWNWTWPLCSGRRGGASVPGDAARHSPAPAGTVGVAGPPRRWRLTLFSPTTQPAAWQLQGRAALRSTPAQASSRVHQETATALLLPGVTPIYQLSFYRGALPRAETPFILHRERWNCPTHDTESRRFLSMYRRFPWGGPSLAQLPPGHSSQSHCSRVVTWHTTLLLIRC